MLSQLSLLLLATAPTIHHGRQKQLDVRPPRIQAEVAIDGRLDEAPWQEAAVLTGFSRYAPSDGIAADDSTDVLVWYSATAIHFGIRAYAPPGSVNATLADRDKMYNDDYISLFLSTFNNGREATVISVNPLGAQGDGIVVERGQASSGGGFGATQVGREPTDISPDYVFQSKGRLTEFGYQIEIRIPFKSLRYQSALVQSWGVNVLRRVQSRGYEYSWAPAERGAQSFIGQFGHLHEMSEMHRGVVLDLNPIVTSRATGAFASPRDYAYASKSEIGGNVRWGISTNWTMNGTINPDFAEVESDAGQIVNDPRRALFFAERRPFFLDGIEQFAVNNNLIYTRRIAAPLVAAKVTGKRGGTTYAILSAIDDKLVSLTQGDRPLYNILRLQHDLGKSSRVGLVYTDRTDGDYSNRVLGGDARIVWKNIYSAQLQTAGSRTAPPRAATETGQLHSLALRRAGRVFAAQYRFNLMDDEFQAASGFINRPAIVTANFRHSFTLYGKPGALVERATFENAVDGLWNYRPFVDGDDMLEKKLHFNNNFSLRGGWQVGGSFLVETFGYDDPLFASVYVEDPGPNGTVSYRPFSGRDRLGNIDYVVSLTTPNYRKFSASTQLVWGRDENFYEWTSANIGWIDLNLNWRPTEQLRVTGSYDWQGYRRLSDNSQVAETSIPRVRVEYQVTRSIFLRVVGQYTADYADDLRESDRSNNPLFRKVGTRFVRARGFSTVERRANRVNTFRPEFLFSYLPSPGTVIYAGYNSTMTEPESFRFGRGTSGLQRQSDAFFVKLSWLFRT
ncbi:MAG: DUF5916 domain-containing protein [Gemmatimonadaceae bacterium]